MTPEDRISIIKFTKLVENCGSKEEILDLCVKALKKYRPEEIRNKTMENDFLTFMNSGRVTRTDSYVVKAIHSIDIHTMQYVDPNELEKIARKEIGYKLSSTLNKEGLIKYQIYDHSEINKKDYVGTLEVVMP